MMTGIELLLSVMLLLVVISVSYGLHRNIRMEIMIEINMLNTPYYNLGISYNRVYEDEEQYIDELTIGLVLINFNVLFYKDSDA